MPAKFEVHTYQKLPVDIHATVWPGGAENATPVIDWILQNGGTARYHEADATHHDAIMIDTLEGSMFTNPGDVVIQGVSGEFYPCKPDIFKLTYRMVGEPVYKEESPQDA